MVILISLLYISFFCISEFFCCCFEGCGKTSVSLQLLNVYVIKTVFFCFTWQKKTKESSSSQYWLYLAIHWSQIVLFLADFGTFYKISDQFQIFAFFRFFVFFFFKFLIKKLPQFSIRSTLPTYWDVSAEK